MKLKENKIVCLTCFSSRPLLDDRTLSTGGRSIFDCIGWAWDSDFLHGGFKRSSVGSDDGLRVGSTSDTLHFFADNVWLLKMVWVLEFVTILAFFFFFFFWCSFAFEISFRRSLLVDFFSDNSLLFRSISSVARSMWCWLRGVLPGSLGQVL